MPILGAFMVPHPPMIIPEIGEERRNTIQKTIESYERVAAEIASLKPDVLLISSPHTYLFSDYFYVAKEKQVHGDFSSFGCPSISFSEDLDEEFVEKLTSIAKEEGFPTGVLERDNSKLDHGAMVPLYFIRKYLPRCPIVLIGLSGLDYVEHYRMGQLLQQVVQQLGRKTVYIASGDLSHKLQKYGPYGYVPEGPIYDQKIMDLSSRADFGELFRFLPSFCDLVSECGHRSFLIMAGVLDGMNVVSRVYSHEDITGVGYGVCSFYPNEVSNSRKFLDSYLLSEKDRIQKMKAFEDIYIRFAREVIEEYVMGNTLDNSSIPIELQKDSAGVFVTIFKHHFLRGCIGTFLPITSCVGEEILHNAPHAATQDIRFSPIEKHELPYLEIHVDVLSKPEDVSSFDELDPHQYGVIVQSDGKRGLLLPDLDGVDTVQKQIEIACRKGDILPDSDISIMRFTVTRHQVSDL